MNPTCKFESHQLKVIASREFLKWWVQEATRGQPAISDFPQRSDSSGSMISECPGTPFKNEEAAGTAPKTILVLSWSQRLTAALL